MFQKVALAYRSLYLGQHIAALDISLLIWCTFKIFWKMINRTHHRKRRHTTHGTQRAVQHGFTEILEQNLILFAVLTAADFVDNLHAARRTNPARCAFAA